MIAHAFLLIAASVLAAPDKAGDDAKKELERLEGAWVGTSAEFQGMQAPAEEAKLVKLVCKGEKYTFRSPGAEPGKFNEEKGTLKLDPAKKPKALDISITEGNDKGKTQLAIYELDGDTLKVCANLPDAKERPKQFSTTEGGGQIMFTFKREKKDK